MIDPYLHALVLNPQAGDELYELSDLEFEQVRLMDESTLEKFSAELKALIQKYQLSVFVHVLPEPHIVAIKDSSIKRVL